MELFATAPKQASKTKLVKIQSSQNNIKAKKSKNIAVKKKKPGKKNVAKSSGGGASCLEASDGAEFCSVELEEKINELDKVSGKNVGKESTMSYYSQAFNGFQTKSQNCFTQNDPTVAVNQGSEEYLGKIIVITSGGKKRYALATDTGPLKENSGTNRDLDATTSLFTSLEPLSEGLVKDLKWKSIGKATFRGSKGIQTYKFENVIACLKKKNIRQQQIEASAPHGQGLASHQSNSR